MRQRRPANGAPRRSAGPAARPIWQRRPRLVGATALALALVLATSGLLLAKPWQPAALSSVAEDSIGIIDPGRDEVVKAIAVGTRPGGIAVGEGYAWVTNTGDDTVSQIDLAQARWRSGSPSGTLRRASPWPAAWSGWPTVVERTVSRINAATGRVVGIPSTSGTAPPRSPPPETRCGSPTRPTARSSASTPDRAQSARGSAWPPGRSRWPPTRTDSGWRARTARQSATMIRSPAPRAPCRSSSTRGRARSPSMPTSVWVASADGKVTRIDRGGNGVTATIPVGRSLATIAISGERDLGRRSGWDRLPARRGQPVLAAEADLDEQRRGGAGRGGRRHLAGRAGVGGQPPRRNAAHRRVTSRRCAPIRHRSARLSALRRRAARGGRPRRLPARGRQRRFGIAARSRSVASGDQRWGANLHLPLRPGLEYSTGAPVRAVRFPACHRTQLPGDWLRRPLGPFLYSSIAGAKACTNDQGLTGQRLRPVPGHRDRRCGRHHHVLPLRHRTRTSSTSLPIRLRTRCPKASR